MLKRALLLLRKDMRLILLRGAGLAQALLLGLLLVFLFSLSLESGEKLGPQSAAAMFWLSSVFCQVLIFNMLYALEEVNLSRLGLLLLPAPPQFIWLGKALAGLGLILLAQCVFLPACFVFLGQNPGPAWATALMGILLCDLGMAACGSLLGALSVGQAGRESLLSIVLFPLLLPLLLAGVELLAAGITLAPAPENGGWLGIAAAFDALFVAAALVLFPFIYTGEDA